MRLKLSKDPEYVREVICHKEQVQNIEEYLVNLFSVKGSKGMLPFSNAPKTVQYEAISRKTIPRSETTPNTFLLHYQST